LRSANTEWGFAVALAVMAVVVAGVSAVMVAV